MKHLLLLLILICSFQILPGQVFSPIVYNPALWLDASDSLSVIHNNGSVLQWQDLSGNGNTPFQDSLQNQPLYLSSASGIYFDGDDVLIGNNLLYGPDTSITLFVVAEPDGGSPKGSVIAKGQWTSGSDYRIELGENGYDICIQNAREWNSSSNDWNIAHRNLCYTYYSQEGEVGYFLNGSRQEYPRFNIPYNPNSSPFSIGGRFTYYNFFKGKILEIILFQSKLDYCEIQQIEGYLIHKWELSEYIPDFHTFKNLPFGICDELPVFVDENAASQQIIDTLSGIYTDSSVLFTDWRIENEEFCPGTFSLSPQGILRVENNSLLDYERSSAYMLGISAIANNTRVYGNTRINLNNLSDGDPEKTNSLLWGESGELWNPRGRLPDFSYVSYKNGESEYSYPQTILDVTLFGANGSDTLSDKQAIDSALSVVPSDGAIIYFPAGRYIIDAPIYISQSNIILRGAGNDSVSGTRFYFPYSAEDMIAAGTINSGGNGTMIQFTGNWSGPSVPIIETSLMGDRSITVSNASAFSVGDIIELSFSGPHPADGELWDYILNNQNSNWPCSVPWSNGSDGLMMFHTIERIDGNIVTLKEPIRLDLRTEWNPNLVRRSSGFLMNCGIEHIFMEHHFIPMPVHLQEPGFNAISFNRVFNSWVNDVSIKHGDNPIRFDISGFCEIRNISYFGRAGHHGWTFAYSSHCLADSINYYNYEPWYHSFTLTHKANGNVVSNIHGNGQVISTDFHRNTPWECLITNVDSFWNYNSSGVWCAGPNAGKRTVYWNMQGDGFTTYPLWDEYQTTLVGEMHIPESFHPEKGWHENVVNIQPQNLYEAQLSRRLNQPEDPLFQPDNFIGNRNNWFERDPSRWKVQDQNGYLQYQLYFEKFPSLSGNRPGEYSILDSIFSNNMTITCDVQTLSDTNIYPDLDAILIVNYQDDGNYIFARISTIADSSGIFMVQNYQASLIKDLQIAMTPNTINTFSLQRTDSLIIVYELNNPVDSVENTSFPGGKVGIGGFNSCIAFDNIHLYPTLVTTTPEKKSTRIKVFPNPATTEIIIDVQNASLIQTTISNISGSIVKLFTGSKQSVIDLEQGIYFLKIKTDHGTFTAKFCKI